MSLTSARAYGALGSHRFLMRAALAGIQAYAWVFALQHFYARSNSLSEAFVQAIVLYALSQVITALLTPYSARRINNGIRLHMIYGVLLMALALSLLAGALTGIVTGAFGMIGFALCVGAYRAMYWTPYAYERDHYGVAIGLSQEFLIALMPALVGYSLFGGALGALAGIISATLILMASIAPLLAVPEVYERYTWSYGETFAELFESKYDTLVQSAFLEGMQGAALLFLWPLSVFILVGSSYRLLGIVLTLSLLLSIPLKAFGERLVHRHPLLHMTIAISAWVMRLAAMTPLTIIMVDVYASTTRRHSVDRFTLEQSADNASYVDELTALKEISMSIGRLTMCAIASIGIVFFSLSVGLAVAFITAAIAAAMSIYLARKASY